MRAVHVCELAAPTGRRWPRFGNVLVPGFPFIEAEVEYALGEYCRYIAVTLPLHCRYIAAIGGVRRGRVLSQRQGSALAAHAPRLHQLGGSQGGGARVLHSSPPCHLVITPTLAG